MKNILFSAAFCFAALCGIAQGNDVELKLTLRDGNVVSGTSRISNIVLVTDYGKLEIPLKNVTSLDLGLSSDKPGAAKIASLVKQLSNSDEKLRKSAYDELVQSDIRAIVTISDLISSAGYEPSTFTDYTADAALSELESKYGVDSGFSSKDVISIDYEYTIGGVYDFTKIELKTEYGTLSIPKEKIRHIDVLYSGGSGNGELTFKLMGSKHISANPNGGWLKTGIMVKAGQKLNISASGEITFASLSGSAYKPDGSIAGSTAAVEAGMYDSYGSGATYPTYGNVVYKIGENSAQALKAGAKFSGTAAANGMLYISVYETVYNAANSGSYTVKIALK
ncbi:MAG: hypothetical protein JWO09_662 [Bacteroidetes bacterium]|nr:hypothetical protein [Bacteroidota bacterium]